MAPGATQSGQAQSTLSAADGQSGTAMTNSLIADVQRDAAAGDTRAIAVDLDLLEVFYGHLWRLHEHIDSLQSSSNDSESDAFGIGETITATDGQLQIAGVVDAVTKARQVALGVDHGLRGSLASVRAQIVHNLRALYDCYEAYNDTDFEGTSELNSALAKSASAHYR